MRKRKNRRSNGNEVGAAELESTILQAVKATPGCETVAGVIVRPKTPSSDTEPNWEVQGVKFGGADRTVASDALGPVVARLQRELRLKVETTNRPPIVVHIPIDSSSARGAR